MKNGLLGYLLRKGILFVTAAMALLAPPDAIMAARFAASPPFEVTDLDGVTHRSETLQQEGNLTIVMFWALRCASCLQEMDTLEDLFLKYQEKGLRVIAVEAAGNEGKAITHILRRLENISIRPSYPIVPDVEYVMVNKFGVKVTPRTFLIDKEGKILISFSDFSTRSKDTLIAKIEDLLGVWMPPVEEKVEEEKTPSVLTTYQPSGPTAAEGKDLKKEKKEDFDRSRYFADFYLHQKEYVKALEHYEKCLTLEEGNHYIRLKLGEVSALLQDFTRARELWEGILREDPRHEEADAMLKKLLKGEFKEP